MKYKEGYRYVLAAQEVFSTGIHPARIINTEFISLYPSGRLELAFGYAWDGSTFALQTRWCKRGSACHDAICQLIQLGLLDRKWKRQGDYEYYNLCREDGMPLPMAINRLFWIQFHDWENSRPAEILTAP